MSEFDGAARVVRVYSGGVEVDTDAGIRRATLRGKLMSGRRRAKHILAPGDWVRLTQATGEAGGDAAEGNLAVEEICSRRNRISRTAADGRHEQVLYANVDLLIVVGSVGEPSLRPGLFDRFLVAAERDSIPAMLVANKADLGVGDGARAVAEVYRRIGYDMIFTSVDGDLGLAEFKTAATSAELVVLAGHSGVGKSSLLNRLFPEFHQETREISKKYGRGRHTTSQTLLQEVEPGHYLADTPGVRSFTLHDMLPDEIAFCFREFAPLIPQCRFKGCTHVHEPGCAVKAAVARGDIATMRYRSYLRIIEEDEVKDE